MLQGLLFFHAGFPVELINNGFPKNLLTTLSILSIASSIIILKIMEKNAHKDNIYQLESYVIETKLVFYVILCLGEFEDPWVLSVCLLLKS